MHLAFFTFALAAAAVIWEAWLGYPEWLFAKIGHPVTWMGRLIAALDLRLNRDGDAFALRRAAGFAALIAVLVATGLGAALLDAIVFALFGSNIIGLALAALFSSSCLAQRSLFEHVDEVAQALAKDDIDGARTALSRIVGRDVAVLDQGGISRAAIESLAENFSDGIVAPSLWLALLGPLGGFLYKAVNTADSMIGHRSPRHAAFGFAAAKFDDLVNLVPARLAALWLCLSAERKARTAAWHTAFRITWRDASGHPSPNAGWPEAAMAGGLGIRLGGPRTYAGKRIEDRWIGDGESDLAGDDIFRALRLYRRACIVNFAALLLAACAKFLVTGQV